MAFWSGTLSYFTARANLSIVNWVNWNFREFIKNIIINNQLKIYLQFNLSTKVFYRKIIESKLLHKKYIIILNVQFHFNKFMNARTILKNIKQIIVNW